MAEAILMVLAAVAVLAMSAGLTWICLHAVTRSERDLETCEAIWAMTPDV